MARCTIEDSAYNYRSCTNCNMRQESLVEEVEYKFNYIKNTDLIADTMNLAKYVPHNCKGIAGVARSGLISASLLATHLHIPLYEISIGKLECIQLNKIKGGDRISDASEMDGPLFVVDDTVYEGNVMTLLRNLLPQGTILSAVYVRPERVSLVDHYAVRLSAPHLLEWNIFNSAYIEGIKNTPFEGGIAFDFDGILCEDPVQGADRSDDTNWLENSLPTAYLPRRSNIPLIITMRLEKWRSITEKWLEKYRIKCDDILMWDSDIESRDSDFVNSVIKHKATKLKESKCFMMIESDPFQSEIISRYSGKPVLCPAEGKIYHNELNIDSSSG